MSLKTIRDKSYRMPDNLSFNQFQSWMNNNLDDQNKMILEFIKMELEDHFNIYSPGITNMMIYGSTIYGTQTDKSDVDVLCIIQNYKPINQEYSVNNINTIIIDSKQFQNSLTNYSNMVYLESYFSPVKLYPNTIPFTIDKSLLRKLISATSSNSYVKTKKKLQDGEYYIGIKSLFHSIRIIMYGIQLAKNNKIIDWGCANKYWNNIIAMPDTTTWNEFKTIYQPIRNSLLTEFRLLAPL